MLASPAVTAMRALGSSYIGGSNRFVGKNTM
jgi:hypothetical protein